MIVIDTTTLDEDMDNLSDSELYWVYNGLDCCITLEVFEKLEAQLDATTRATYDTAMQLMAPVMEMMLEGLPVSHSARQSAIEHYQRELDDLELYWEELCVDGLGFPPGANKRKGKRSIAVNYSSPKQVLDLFKNVFGLTPKRKRNKATGEMGESVDRETLESFRNHYYAEPVVNLILAMRDRAKMLGFLRTPLDADMHIRCSFNVAGTDTGRLSSSFSDMGTGTNLQNVTGKAKEIFWAPEGWMFVDVDLGQGDSRGVGARCWNLFYESHGPEFAGSYLDACESGDLHTTVCRMAWQELSWGTDPKGWKDVAEGKAYRDLSYRDLAKKLGHGTNYLGQPNTMAMHTKLPVPLISDFQAAYFSAFPCIPAWHSWTKNELRTTGILTSLWGRRRVFWNDREKQSTLNAAIAYDPQNTTGEFTNRGMIQLWLYRNRHNLPIRFLLQVHDSLVFLVPAARVNELVPLILKQLRVTLPLVGGRDFSIPHDAKVGWNYGKVNQKKNENPFGLLEFRGEEKRSPPPSIRNLRDLFEVPVGSLR